MSNSQLIIWSRWWPMYQSQWQGYTNQLLGWMKSTEVQNSHHKCLLLVVSYTAPGMRESCVWAILYCRSEENADSHPWKVRNDITWKRLSYEISCVMVCGTLSTDTIKWCSYSMIHVRRVVQRWLTGCSIVREGWAQYWDCQYVYFVAYLDESQMSSLDTHTHTHTRQLL